MPDNDSIHVRKLNIHRQETFHYMGRLLEVLPDGCVLEGIFQLPEIDVQGMPLRPGDRFIERYYTDRWYNTYEIFANEDGTRRGWYCNICYPAEIDGNTVSFVDLALDLLVFPDGRQIVLDEDEFTELELTEELQQQARRALAELMTEFQSRFTAD
jgi:hypothetical protein